MRLSSINSTAFTGIGQLLGEVVPVDAMIMEAVVPTDPVLASQIYLKIWDSNAAVTVNWGDGSVSSITGSPGNAYHDYSASLGETVTITVSGYLPSYGSQSEIGMFPGQGQNFIRRVLQWNSTTTNFRWAFEGEALLTEVPASLPVGVTDTKGMFWGCLSFGNNPPYTQTNGGNFSNGYIEGHALSMYQLSTGFQEFWGTGDITPGTSVVVTFYNGTSFTSEITASNWGGVPGDYISLTMVENFVGFSYDINSVSIIPVGTINNWDVSSVTNMSHMFTSCVAFNTYLGNWNVSNVTDMSYMFHMPEGVVVTLDSPIFVGGGLKLWDVSSVTNMEQMFSRSSSFNEPIGQWNVSSVTNMIQMFAGATVFNQPIGGWDTVNVDNMADMFINASAFDQNLTGWSVPLCTDSSIDGFTLDPVWGNAGGVSPIWGSTQTPLITVFNGDFADLYFFPGQNFLSPNAVIDWGDGARQTIPYGGNFGMYTHQYATSGTYTVTVRGYLPNMQGGTIAYGGPVAPTTTGMTAVTEWNSTTINLNAAFEHRTALTNVPDYIPSGVTTTTAMFLEAAKINDPNIALWDMSNVTSMYGMFADTQTFNQDLSGWNVTNIPVDPWTNGGYGSNMSPAGILQLSYWPVWGTDGGSVITTSYTGRMIGLGTDPSGTYATLVPTYALTSNDTWTSATTVPASFANTTRNWLYNISAESSGSLTMIINGETGHTATTTDGITWTERTRLTPNSDVNGRYWNTLAYGNSTWVTVFGGNINYDSTSAAYSTNNGTTWNYVTIPAGRWARVVFGNGRFVCTNGYTPGSTIYSTDNGATWSTGGSGNVPMGLPTPSAKFSFFYAGGSINKFMMVRGSFQELISVTSSSDGITWADKSNVAATGMTGYSNDYAAYGNDRLVVIQGFVNSTWVSTDAGANWTRHTGVFDAGSIYFSGIYYFNGVFIVTTRTYTGQTSTTYISSDGVSWHKGGTSTGISNNGILTYINN